MSARVLVVDDIAVNVKLLEAKLLVEYYEVVTASDGPSALKAAKEHAPDIVLLDVMMPGMDGPTTLQRLRELPGAADVPAIFMTAKVQPQEVESLKRAGALEVIAKPFDPMTLSDTIREIWRNGQP
jgi:CheY-like chemotaxis protein